MTKMPMKLLQFPSTTVLLVSMDVSISGELLYACIDFRHLPTYRILLQRFSDSVELYLEFLCTMSAIIAIDGSGELSFRTYAVGESI